MTHRFPRQRGGNALVGMVVLICCACIVACLLMLALQKIRKEQMEVCSRHNLGWIGVAVNQYAAANNTNLPNAGPGAPHWFSGVKSGPAAAGPPSSKSASKGILDYLKGGRKTLEAPLDPNLDPASGGACSYSIPEKWATLSGGTGNLVLPACFPRGLSVCIGAAEMTTYGVAFDNIKPFQDTPYTRALPGKGATTANSFVEGKCQVLMMDGAVKIIALAENTASYWESICNPYEHSNLSPTW